MGKCLFYVRFGNPPVQEGFNSLIRKLNSKGFIQLDSIHVIANDYADVLQKVIIHIETEKKKYESDGDGINFDDDNEIPLFDEDGSLNQIYLDQMNNPKSVNPNKNTLILDAFKIQSIELISENILI